MPRILNLFCVFFICFIASPVNKINAEEDICQPTKIETITEANKEYTYEKKLVKQDINGECLYRNTKITERAYYSNNKTKYLLVKEYNSKKKLVKQTYKTYTSNGKKTYYKKKINYSNGQAKQRLIYLYHTNEVWKSYSNLKYKKVKSKSYKNYRILVKRKSNKNRISTNKYYFNKKGQLKSNKNGSAYRKYYKYFSNNKVSRYYKYKYNKSGKLKRITYKYYKNNKPKSQLDKEVDLIITLTNAERKKQGLKTLSRKSKLMKGSKIRAKELKSCFAHKRLNKEKKCGSRSYVTIFPEVGYKNMRYGENAAYRTTGSIKGSGKAIYKQWYNSSGHYKLMTNKNMNHIGVGLYYDKSSQTLYAIQLFGGNK